MELYQKDSDNMTGEFAEAIRHLAEAREDCKVMMVSVQNMIDHGSSAAQVIIFRDRTPKDRLCVLKD